MTARELAINVLYKIENAESYSNIEIDKEFSKYDLESIDKALASELIYGVLTWKITIDEIIKMYSSIKLKKISCWILNILRIGIYQIAFLDRIPESAAVNESVKLAKKYGHEASSKFVNAILRKITKDEMDKLLNHLSNQMLMEDEIISIITSHPLWLVDELLKEYDKKFVTELLNANNIKPKITLRTNILKTTRDELVKLLQVKCYECEGGKLPHSIFINKMTDFADKFYSVQDEAAQLAVLKLDPKANDVVLDACSAPGGKTTYIAQLMNNKGSIDAWDIHDIRVKLVDELANKLGIDIIHTQEKDASEYYHELDKKYDKILLDVPCSGIGVIRKKPDIKWTRKIEDLDNLVETQEKILNTCSNYLKDGGRLVYSTCTVFARENREQVKKFLDSNKDFKLIEEVNLYPHIDNTDGFYIAVLERNIND